ncbi:restriction endonuclease [Bacillus sp. FJAT-18017]|uniref:DNA phosphorothioation-dependent restriction protein DptH n=1 Tax=Bacillus sp. FJAT-18017 TaxID=1705566 RepID=UPI0006ADF920|nr:DNA phosphorothioation-dependent restriction protein DptH [Bacillus sp. FJAT-18017]ALC90598.1 restriction endonuclease [Bacillus sp. FJAT-18017]
MSNQFYNYISSLLVNYFKEVGLKAGDRYYLQLDKETDISHLVNALGKIQGSKDFTYKHEFGEEYKTFSLAFNSINLVIAYTSENVKPDFLVTLRNLVGEQKGIWKNTSLLSIVSEQLDSIQGGSSDLQKEGMPLHPSSLFKNLKGEIEKSILPKIDQIILLDNLDVLLKEQAYQQISFFEFEDIFSTLQKGSIDDQEYYKFGLFKDPDLDKFKGKDQKERIQENRDLFDYVRKVHDYGLGQDELEKRFKPEGVRELFKEDWKDKIFPEVFRSKNEPGKKSIELTSLTIDNKIKYWDKPQSETAAGKRKRNIIIFNPEQREEIQLQAGFLLSKDNNSLSSDFLTIPKQFTDILTIQVKQKNILASLSAQPNKATFARFTYRHDKKSSLGAEFLIAILPIEPEYLDPFKSQYLVDPVGGFIELRNIDESLTFGSGFERKRLEVSESSKTYKVTQDEQLILLPLPEAFNDDEALSFNIEFDYGIVPFLLVNELPDSLPINGQRIWKLVRETGMDIQWIKENNRLILENREFYFHSEYREFFEWENFWVEEGLKFAINESDNLNPQDIKLSDNLREAYSRFLTYFKINNSIPSLCTVTDDLKSRSLAYINEYIKEIESFKAGSPAGSKGIDLFKLGMIQSNEVLYFTPFHPLMVAFKLKTYELLNKEEIDNSILTRLTPDALIPFIYDEENLFKPDHQKAAYEWLTFKPVNKVSVSDANHYLAKVVHDKISQFKEHFSYLFINNSQAPLRLNVLNITNDKEVIRGIFQWMLKEIDKNGLEGLKPVEVTLYNNGDFTESAFDLYSIIESIQEFEETFNIKLESKEVEPEDIIRTIREKLSFYKQNSDAEYRYSHITFYKMHAQEHHAVQPMNEMTTGISIEGLYSSVPSMKDEENYKSGFGTKAYSVDDINYLAKTAYFVNELAANLRNGGHDSYRRGEAILSRTTTADEVTLEKVFESSFWVTFVDPSMDLEFFNKYDGNLVVIHYSDQYSSSSRYDAITVTNKSNQYYAVIKEFLKQKDVEGTDQNVLETIRAFNTFNGEWLLRIIGSKGQFDREKLSIISAIKFSVSYFDHPDIKWIPVSLEEILRVAGAVSLNRSEGVFTAKNLGVKGSHSDDLLLIGLENKEGKLSLHFYPVEVKIGLNRGEVLDKARKQVEKTKKLFVETLIGEEGKEFTARFYRNFFVQLLIANAAKLEQNGFWEGKDYKLTDDVIEKLLIDDFEISEHLHKYIGHGAILSFQKNSHHRSAFLEDNVLLLNLTEFDGYNGLVKPVQEMRNWIQEEQNDFIKEEMLSYKYKPCNLLYGSDGTNQSEGPTYKEPKVEKGEIEESLKEENEREDPVSISNVETELDKKVFKEKDEIQESVKKFNETARIKLGKAENSNREIYWEYGNKGLANRHLLISGKSGQGKTYFMQCLLLEKSKLGISSIVIDYTEGFLPNQLEPEFVDFLGKKLKQKIVYSEQLPINPFRKNVRDIGGIQLDESNTDIAERVKSVFAAVYKSLGIQQQNSIYEAILNGLDRYGQNMNLLKLKEMLEEDGSSYAKTALSQIRPLIDRNPFSSDNSFNWKDIIESNGEVYVIQLTGFPRDVQLIITEFILWELWNYSVRNGHKNKPMPVIMDEAQNLDHTEKSPSARILTEGRKFGWSAWYATQFLKSQLSADELARLQNSSQKVYFSPPEQEVSNIAASLTKDNSEKKYWENVLSTLKKGQCIVHGPVLKDNGELSNPTVSIVNITPLSERI